MFETILGTEIPLPLRFFIAFLVVLALIGLTAWVVRRFGSDRLGTNARGRAPRLAVIDAANVDSRRRLIIVRRDNVEHLLMIGGPTDVVVETNIVRGAAPAGREPTMIRPAGADTLPRPVPLGEGAWQEPAPRPAVDERIEPPLRPTGRPSEALAGLAAELSVRPAATPAEPPPRAPRAAPPVEPPRALPASADKIGPMEKNLAQMTERLEASLRRPPTPETPPRQTETAEVKPPEAKPPEVRAPEVKAPVPPAAPPVERPVPPPMPAVERPVPPPTAEVRPPTPRPEPKPAAEPNPFESLEQEMASLLGRNQNKT